MPDPAAGDGNDVGLDMLDEDPGLHAPSSSDDPLETLGDLMSADTDPLPDQVVPDPLPGAQQESDAG